MKKLFFIFHILIALIILTSCSGKKKDKNHSNLSIENKEEKINKTMEESKIIFDDNVLATTQIIPLDNEFMGIWKQVETKSIDYSFSSLCFINDTLLLGDFPEAQEPRYLYRNSDSLIFMISSSDWYIQIMEFSDSTLKIKTNYPRETIHKEFVKVSNESW
jgi:hypothetical protein